MPRPMPAPADRPRALRASRTLWVAAAIGTTLHGAHVIAGLGGRSLAWIASPWGVFAVFALCATAVAARAVASRCRRDRLAWGALAAGLALYALGTPAYTLLPPRVGNPPFLSAPDLLWLALYPPALLAIALLVARHAPGVRRDQWVDGAIGGLAAASLGVIVIFRAVIDPAQAFQLAPWFVAFTLADILVIGFGIGCYALVGWRPPRSVVLLVAGFAAMIVADASYLETIAHGESVDVAWPFTVWLAAMVTIAAAAAWARPRADQPPQLAAPRPRKLVHATIAALVALGTLILQSPADRGAEFSLPLAGLAIIGVIARLALTLRQSDLLIEALERSETHLAEAQRLAGLGSWTWNALDGSTTSSAEQKRLHNWSSDESPHIEDAVDLVIPEDRPKLARALAAAVERGEPLDVDYRVPSPDGTRRIRMQGAAMRDSAGKRIGLMGTCQDVTDAFRREQAERANRAKSEFLSRMSHELRTPLNAILGFGQLLSTGPLHDRQRANVDQILTAGTHLLGLINEVLDISRIEAGDMSVSLEPVDLIAIVSDAVAMMQPLAAERAVTIIVEGSDCDLWALGDQQRLKQVLINLLSNAIKYNRPDGRVIVRYASSGGRVRVAVADTGQGLAPELAARAFEPFERLGAECSDVDGTGLGLPLAKGMVEAMRGHIDLRSLPGQGTTVTVTLDAVEPVTLSQPQARARTSEPPHEDRRTILCIEDNPASLTLLEQILERRPSLRVLTAARGDEGTDLAAVGSPDLVVLDLHLPDIGGEQVLARLKADPATAEVPVVILTASAEPHQRTQLVDAGAHAYLTKPLDVAEFLRVVDDALVMPSLR